MEYIIQLKRIMGTCMARVLLDGYRYTRLVTFSAGKKQVLHIYTQSTCSTAHETMTHDNFHAPAL
jgi:hypothetical protein